MNNTDKIGKIVEASSMPMSGYAGATFHGENYLCWATLVMHDMIEPGRKEPRLAVAGRNCDTCTVGRDLCLMHMLRNLEVGND